MVAKACSSSNYPFPKRYFNLLFADIRELQNIVHYAFYYVDMDKTQHALVKTSSASSRIGFQESRKGCNKDFGCGKSYRSMKVELMTDWPDRSLFNAVYRAQKPTTAVRFLAIMKNVHLTKSIMTKIS